VLDASTLDVSRREVKRSLREPVRPRAAPTRATVLLSRGPPVPHVNHVNPVLGARPPREILSTTHTMSSRNSRYLALGVAAGVAVCLAAWGGSPPPAAAPAPTPTRTSAVAVQSPDTTQAAGAGRGAGRGGGRGAGAAGEAPTTQPYRRVIPAG